MRKYCAFWIPTIYHRDLQLAEENKTSILNYDISDEQADNKHLIDVEADVEKQAKKTDNENDKLIIKSILIRSTLRKREEISQEHDIITSIKLEDFISSRNGTIFCHYDIDENNSQHIAIDKAMPVAIYHIIKDLFHKHEYHSNGSDSTLEALTQRDEINIKEGDNKALDHYLRQYEKKFILYRDRIFNLLKYVKDNDRKLKANLQNENELDSLKSDLFSIKEQHSLINEICNSALGESIYYDSLKCSCYNYYHKIDATDSGSINNGIEVLPNDEANKDIIEQRNDKRRIALNTRSAIDNIHLLQIENKSLWDAKSAKLSTLLLIKNKETNENIEKMLAVSDKSSKIGIGLGILGAVLGLISIVLAIVLS